MITKKTWERFVWAKGIRVTGKSDALSMVRYHDQYTGYFLLGIVPLYVVRSRTRT
jgi:hypothetical protein